MNKRRQAVQCVALVVAYALACSDLRELFLHPARSPAHVVRARVVSTPPSLPDASVSVEQAATVLRAVSPSLQGNCALALQQNAAMASAPVKVVLRLETESDGSVSRLLFEGPTPNTELASCVARSIEPLRFPDSSLESRVTVSLAFSPGVRPPQLAIWTTPRSN